MSSKHITQLIMAYEAALAGKTVLLATKRGNVVMVSEAEWVEQTSREPVITIDEMVEDETENLAPRNWFEDRYGEG